MIEKANAPDDIDGEVFWFSEVNPGLSFQLANGERDFVAVGIERTCCRAKVQENFARVSYRPKVLVNYRSGDSWQVYGGQNAFAQLITDAGGDYLFTEGRGIPRSLLRFRFLFLSSNTPSACCGVVYFSCCASLISTVKPIYSSLKTISD